MQGDPEDLVGPPLTLEDMLLLDDLLTRYMRDEGPREIESLGWGPVSLADFRRVSAHLWSSIEYVAQISREGRQRSR